MMQPQQLPNFITLMRMVLAVPILYFLLKENFKPAFILFVIASLSDGLDGLLARRFQWTSQFGLLADPIADKCLAVCSITALTYLGYFSSWFCVLILFRDFGILFLALILSKEVGWQRFAPRFLSKLNTLLLLVLLTTLLLQISFMPQIPSMLIHVIQYTLVVTTLLSMVDYLWCWRKTLSNICTGVKG